MIYNASNTELFDLYLKRRLSEVDLLAFEKRLKEDKDFAESFAIHQLMVEGVKDHARAELKQFLSASAPTGKVVKFRYMQWAAAAAVVLILGIYGIMQLYVQPKKDQDIAVLEDIVANPEPPTKDSVIPSAPPVVMDSVSTTKSTESFHELVAVDEDMDVIDMERTESSSNKNLNDAEGAPVILDDVNEFKVATEKKIKDSSIVLYNLPLLASNYDNNTYKNKKAMVSKLPQNANNAPAAAKVEEEVTKSKKKAAPSGIKLQVEYWQSPVNFKGYKYWGNTIQLYGVDQNSAKLFAVNNDIYLRDKGVVYLLVINTDATPYKVESDDSIVQLILSQP